MRKRNIESPDQDVVDGVREGLEAVDRLRNPALEARLPWEQAASINLMVQSVIVDESIREVEKAATEIGEVALNNPEVALHCLGGEEAAREEMGDVATDLLLGMIERHRRNVA